MVMQSGHLDRMRVVPLVRTAARWQWDQRAGTMDWQDLLVVLEDDVVSGMDSGMASVRMVGVGKIAERHHATSVSDVSEQREDHILTRLYPTGTSALIGLSAAAAPLLLF